MVGDAIVISDDDEDDELMLAPVAGPCTYNAISSLAARVCASAA
jgi:hypothetical protein